MQWERWRWMMAALVWVEAWLSVPWLPGYITLPAPWSSTYLWNRTWGMALMPAALTLIALAPDFWPPARRSSRVSFALLIVGFFWQTIYLTHRVPPHLYGPMVARWISAGAALSSLTLSLSSPRDNAPPALEVLASAALVLTFVAKPPWADAASFLVLATTVLVLRVKKPL